MTWSGISKSFDAFFGRTYAKHNILIAIAKPACKAKTTTRRIFDVRTSVALRTGYLIDLLVRFLWGRASRRTYKFRNKNRAERLKPMLTKIQFKTSIGDHEMMATGIHTRFA